MNGKRLSIGNFQDLYRLGRFNSPSFDRQVEAGWIDWFCPDTELPQRLKRMWNIISRITGPDALDRFTMDFYNCCPLDDYPLYDEIYFKKTDGKFILHLSMDDERKESRFNISIAEKGGSFRDVFASDSVNDTVSFINRTLAQKEMT